MSTEDIAAAIEKTQDVLDHRNEARAAGLNQTKFHRDHDIRTLVVAASRLIELERLAAEQAPQRQGTVDELASALDAEQRMFHCAEDVIAGLKASLTSAQRELDDSERRRQAVEEELERSVPAAQRDAALDEVRKLREVAQRFREECGRVAAENSKQSSENSALRSRVQALEDALRGLLLSADCGWEERNEGHDWAEACTAARAAIEWQKHG